MHASTVLPLIAALTAVLNRFAESQGMAIPIIHAWLDDVLVLPVALGAALWLHRRSGRAASWTLPVAHAWIAVLVLTIVFEVVLPRFDTSATADPWDVLAYSVGAVLFLSAMNRPARVEMETAS